MPIEVWRQVDDWIDAISHARLRATCAFFTSGLPRVKMVFDFKDYSTLREIICKADGRSSKGKSFQMAVALHPREITQKVYYYLYQYYLNIEMFRVCQLALQPPFACRHIDLSAIDNHLVKLAAEKGNESIVSLLLQDPQVDPVTNSNIPIGLASENGHSAVVSLLLQDARVDPTDNQNYAFRMAARSRQTAVVSLLLQDPRVDPAVLDNAAIKEASEKGHYEIIKLLLQDPRVDPAADHNCAIKLASKNGHIDVCYLLLANNQVCTEYMENPFSLSLFGGDGSLPAEMEAKLKEIISAAQNQKSLLFLMPIELWRQVDDWTDVKSHARLRATCFFLRKGLPRPKKLDFKE